MAYFAEIKNGIVERVIVADLSFLDKLGGTWIETSMDGSLRKNYAGIGYKYDADLNAFIAPKPYDSWVLDDKAKWKSPKIIPKDGKYYFWNESTENWVSTLN